MLQNPVPSQVPIREPADYKGTIRFTDWSAGYDQRRAQEFAGQAIIEAVFYDSQNVDWWSKPGSIQTAAKCNVIDTEGTDKEYLLYGFNNALYRLPTANFAAANVQKITNAVTSTWGALTNIYPGAVAPGGAALWRDQWVIASRDTVVRVMSTAEVWTSIAAPGTVTAPVSGMVGISQDDRLLCWWEGTAQAGLWAWDGTSWSRIYPTAVATTGISNTICDGIIEGAGSTLVFMRDISGQTVLLEWTLLSTGSQFQRFPLGAVRVWPQGGSVFNSDVWFVGKLVDHSNRGGFWRKGLQEEPELIAELDTNFATASQVGLDWSWRCVYSQGDVLLLGGSSREDHTPAFYRFFIDPDTGVPTFGPMSQLPGVAGPIYSIAMLPPTGTNASTTERVFYTTTLRTGYKDRDNGTDPTLDAETGFLQFPDIDLGVADHDKIGNFTETFLQSKSAGGTVTLQYRVNPTAYTQAWSTFGVAAAQGLNHFTVPDDNPALQKYGQRFRTLQLRLVFQRATSGTVRDVVETVMYNVAQITRAEAA